MLALALALGGCGPAGEVEGEQVLPGESGEELEGGEELDGGVGP